MLFHVKTKSFFGFFFSSHSLFLCEIFTECSVGGFGKHCSLLGANIQVSSSRIVMIECPKNVIPPWLSPMVSQWHNWQSYYFRQMSLAHSHQDIQAEIIKPSFFELPTLLPTFFPLCFPMWFLIVLCWCSSSRRCVCHLSKTYLTGYKDTERYLSEMTSLNLG